MCPCGWLHGRVLHKYCAQVLVSLTKYCPSVLGLKYSASGRQAVVLNKVVDELEADHPAKMNEMKLKEVLGHTPRQVGCV
jgi:acid phosphatase family membrane protein YuiD